MDALGWSLLGGSAAWFLLVMAAYFRFMSSGVCVGCLDRSLVALRNGSLRRVVELWLRVAGAVRLAPLAAFAAVALIAGSWIAFPHLGVDCFQYLSGAALLAALASMAGWWTWALERGRCAGGGRYLNLGTACGALYLLAVWEGTVGYFCWVFCAGYFLD